ncbi:MAG TPA: alpha/beta hydrolase [Chthoniobacteraceae bacterium]|jgi:pimeloyl-ACP methyl ester carboxylesterase|nr:alpha/beta hydrolase [Chthoniobacteraceae bacterium]
MTRALFRRHRVAQPSRALVAAANDHTTEAPPVSRPLRFGKLHGVEVGSVDGPLVILLHGFPDFSWGWRKQVPALVALGYHVIVPDQRGYAHSDKPLDLADYRLPELASDVLAIADACGRDRFRLIGHDWGGLVAWWTAARHPHRVEQLVVINAPHPEAWTKLGDARRRQACKSWYAAFFQLPWLPEFILRLRNFRLLRRTLRGSSREGTFTAGTLDHYTAAWSQPGALTAMLNYYRALRLQPRGPLPRLTRPTLLLWGELDDFLDHAIAEASLGFCDHARAVFFPDATHWVHVEEAEAVNEAITAFFAEAAECAAE